MKTLIIDRFEGRYAICEGKDKHFFALELAELPQGAREGDVLEISDDGVITINADKTAQRRDRILKKQNALWE